MQVSLEAIKFNHDPLSATVDAINIRKNETETVPIPEWKCDSSVQVKSFPAAYALSETLGNKITIRAKFKCFDKRIKSLEIRAIDPANSFLISELDDLVDGLTSWLIPSTRLLHRNVLGRVKKRQVVFREDGESDFEAFELAEIGIWRAGVSVSITTWQWQFRTHRQAPWINFATSYHRIYTILKMPKDPWSHGPLKNDNKQLPWSEVLDHACVWAGGAQNIDEAAVGITRGVRNLEKTTHAVYDTHPYYSYPNFKCSSFLKLVRGASNVPQKLNCDDFATIVSTFANVLGCDLWQAGLGAGRNFVTNPIRLFGRMCWEVRVFTGHEVAWKGACTKNEEVFDACLEVDGDDDPTIAPYKPLLPVNMFFGQPGDLQYVFALAPPPTPGHPRPSPAHNRNRKSISPDSSRPGKRIKGKLLRFLKEHYEYKEWIVVPDDERLSLVNVLPLTKEFENWRFVEPLQLIRTSNRPPVLQGLFQSKVDAHVLMRLDVDVCVSERAARHFLLQRLGLFHSPSLERRTDLAVGNVTFVEAETGAILFARANLVILVRNAGRKGMALKAIAGDLDRLVMRNPATEGDQIYEMDEFSVPDSTFVVGEHVPILYSGPISDSRVLKFFTPSGCVLQDQGFTYQPIRGGQQQLTVFAITADNKALRQRLVLNVVY